MDEIAYGLGMGKGTLYKYFESKENLMISIVDSIACGLREKITALFSDERLGGAAKLQGFLEIVGMHLATIPAHVMTDVMRNAPAAYERVDEMRRQMIEQILTNLIRSGIADGVFRPDTDAEIIVQMAIGSVNQLSAAQIFAKPELSMEQIFRKVIGTLLCGCLTDRGRLQLLEEKSAPE